MEKMLDSLKDLEKNFYAIWELYGSNQDNIYFNGMVDLNELIEKLDEQIEILEKEKNEESDKDNPSLEHK